MTMIPVKVPDIGDASDVDVVEVLVAAGDQVEKEQSLIVLESDKASMEIPAPQAGVVKELKLSVGDKVSQGSVILMLEGEGGATEAAAEASNGAGARKAAPQPRGEAGSSSTSTEEQPVRRGSGERGAQSTGRASAAGGSETITVKVPDIGDASDVDVVEVLVQSGMAVEREQSLIVLEGDKASMEIPAPQAGVVVKMLVAVGDKVSEGSPILTLETEGADAATEPAPSNASAAPEPPRRDAQRPPAAPRSQARAAGAGAATSSEKPSAAPAEGTKRSHATPSVRKLARELGVDLAHVQGTGPYHRITREDVQRYVKHAMSVAGTQTGSGFAFPELPEIDFSQFGEVHVEPLTKIQKVAGRNLHRSWVTIPHVTQFDKADITELEAFRKKLRSESPQEKITLLSFFMKALVVVLKRMPRFNASLDRSGESLVYKNYFHVGVAVDTDNGLVVPVIRDVDIKGLSQLARELAEVSQRARARKLAPKDMQGASMTISSLGGIGGTAFTPIINPPEVAILGVSRAEFEPVYKNGEFVPRLICPLSLSYDHRVIDGADAARFTTLLREVLGDIRQMLL